MATFMQPLEQLEPFNWQRKPGFAAGSFRVHSGKGWAPGFADPSRLRESVAYASIRTPEAKKCQKL